MEKIRHLANGQWQLSKSTQDFNNAGETHEVEVHPDMDHLYRVKSMISRSGKPSMQVGDIKKKGVSESIINKLPRDASGKVTPEMIDEHISRLPKQKVVIKTAPYTWDVQKHHPDSKQHAVSVQFHPDTMSGVDPDTASKMKDLLQNQHNLIPSDNDSNQIGWSRIDSSKPDHWHIDEIQSDFNSKQKIINSNGMNEEQWMDRAVDNEYDDMQRNAEHPLHQRLINDGQSHELTDDVRQHLLPKWRGYQKELAEMHQGAHVDKVLKILSHGHEDPQHLIHSAVNALARKKDVKSLSMDTLKDQAKQSGLDVGNTQSTGFDYINNQDGPKIHEKLWQEETSKLKDPAHSAYSNPNFKSALDKIPLEDLENAARQVSGADMITPGGFRVLSSETKRLTMPERDAVMDYLRNYHTTIKEHVAASDPKLGEIYKKMKASKNREADLELSPEEKAGVPVHVLNTYDKRPKKLGYQNLPKNQIMPDMSDENNPNQQVQFSPVFKAIAELKNKLNKIKGMK
jgi:hypothetical protein